MVDCGVRMWKSDQVVVKALCLAGAIERRAVGGVEVRGSGGSIRGSEMRVGVVGVTPGIRALLPGSCNWGSLCGDGVPSLSLG